MTAAVIAFWFSLLAIVYAYVGYPAVLWLISRSRVRRGAGTREGRDLPLPSVTLIVSAYNEESVIGAKIKNALALDYPKELLEIMVVSDGSTDTTVEIVAGFANDGVVLKHYEGRIGKTACLNRGVPVAQGDVVVFSDANSQYDAGALKALVQRFDDGSVGFVTGWTRYAAGEGASATASLGLYSRLELATKALESQVGSCVGADGAIFAIRRNLYQPLKSYDINDFVIPLSINEQGYRGVLAKGAVCTERDAGSSSGEFRRQVRITNRTLRAIGNHRKLLNPHQFGLFSFQLASHKVAKFLVPFWMGALLISNLTLVGQGHLYLVTMVGQAVFYALAVAPSARRPADRLTRLSEAARTFVVVNVAIAVAWLKYFQGETYTTWAPTQR